MVFDTVCFFCCSVFNVDKLTWEFTVKIGVADWVLDLIQCPGLKPTSGFTSGLNLIVYDQDSPPTPPCWGLPSVLFLPITSTSIILQPGTGELSWASHFIRYKKWFVREVIISYPALSNILNANPAGFWFHGFTPAIVGVHVYGEIKNLFGVVVIVVGKLITFDTDAEFLMKEFADAAIELIDIGCPCNHIAKTPVTNGAAILVPDLAVDPASFE